MARRRKKLTTDELVGEVIRIWRDEVGLTQVQLAVLLEVCPSSVVRWEHGHASPRVSYVLAMEGHQPGLVSSISDAWSKRSRPKKRKTA